MWGIGQDAPLRQAVGVGRSARLRGLDEGAFVAERGAGAGACVQGGFAVGPADDEVVGPLVRVVCARGHDGVVGPDALRGGRLDLIAEAAAGAGVLVLDHATVGPADEGVPVGAAGEVSRRDQGGLPPGGVTARPIDTYELTNQGS